VLRGLVPTGKTDSIVSRVANRGQSSTDKDLSIQLPVREGSQTEDNDDAMQPMR
jgi:hypothetical protein